MVYVIPFIIGTVMWMIFHGDERPWRLDMLGWHLAGANLGWYLVDIIKAI